MDLYFKFEAILTDIGVGKAMAHFPPSVGAPVYKYVANYLMTYLTLANSLGRLVNISKLRVEIVKLSSYYPSTEATHQRGGVNSDLRYLLGCALFALGDHISCMLEEFSNKFSKINENAIIDFQKLIAMKAFARKSVSSNQYPEELVKILNLRIKNSLDNNVFICDDLESLPMENILSRVQLLTRNANITAEKGRSVSLETNSRFLIAARNIIKEEKYDA